MLKFRPLISAIVIAITLSGCNPLDWFSNVTVEYQVSGTASDVIINFAEGSETVSQVRDVELPWSKEVEVKSGREIHILARSIESSETTITAEILKDGEVIASETTESAFAVAVAKVVVD